MTDIDKIEENEALTETNELDSLEETDSNESNEPIESNESETDISENDTSIKTKKPFYKRWYVILTAIIIVAVLIFNYFFTIVVVNGESMEPNFQDGNVMIARRHFDIWRFDVVTIASEDANMILIKRVIGLPNETVKFENGELYINGEYKPDAYSLGNTEDFEIKLGEDEYFCMGDNREHSMDSRKLGAFTKDEIFAKLDRLTNYKN